MTEFLNNDNFYDNDDYLLSIYNMLKEQVIKKIKAKKRKIKRKRKIKI
jgi:hypothetical protein